MLIRRKPWVARRLMSDIGYQLADVSTLMVRLPRPEPPTILESSTYNCSSWRFQQIAATLIPC